MTVQSPPEDREGRSGSHPAAGLPLPVRLEIVPTEGIVAEVQATLPAGSELTVTCLPHHGLEPTVQTALRLASLGYTVVPHLAARAIEGRAQLERVLREAEAAGITQVFAVGGDGARAAGPYANGLELMEDIADLSGGRIAIGVAGYPEGHPRLSESELMDSLLAKQHLAANIVTQMCFSAPTISAYAALIRREGVDLPVWAGVPGPVPRTRLVSLAAKIGVGPSLKFIRSKGQLAKGLLSGDTYAHEGLVSELSDPAAGLAGIHVFTFNSLGGRPEAPRGDR